MKIGYSWSQASGESAQDCHVLGYRFDERYGWDRQTGEMYVLQLSDNRVHVLARECTWFTGLWRSPSGRVYVARRDGRLLVQPDPATGGPWQAVSIRAILGGVWGLRDDSVMTWGGSPDGPGDAIHRWDGAQWTVSGLPQTVVAMHGVAPDLIVAVGNFGMIARWDGDRWIPVPSPTTAALSDVYVVSADEMYAVAQSGVLLEGSIYGWAEVLNGPMPLHCVARYGDEVLVGASASGLWRLRRDRLECISKDLHAERFDARSGLLVTAPDRVAHSLDGETFSEVGVEEFVKATANDTPGWPVDETPEEDDDA